MISNIIRIKDHNAQLHIIIHKMIFLDHNIKFCKMIEIYLKYDNMYIIRTINAFI